MAITQADADADYPIYRECLTMHYWAGLGNGTGLIAKVDFYDSQTCIRWLPQTREQNAVAIQPATLEAVCKAIREDEKRVGLMLTPNLSAGR